jgi:Spy/CpxP family protein refolding chaperone
MSRPLALVVVVGSAVLCGSLEAQEHDPTKHNLQRPYTGLDTRTIKALSEEQVADLRAGRGVGLALAAELNGYPGPLHTLELAEPLKLTAEQRSRIKDLYDAMRAEAIIAGEALIRAEAALDKLFVEGNADANTLETAMRGVGHAYMVLRRTHLAYHLQTKGILTREQVVTYNGLRGYGKK